MRVHSKCPNCTHQISIFSLADTRAELALQKGEEISIRCKSCGKTSKVHVNDFRAKPARSTKLLAALLFIGGLIAVFWLSTTTTVGIYYWVIFPGLILAPMIAYRIIRNYDSNRVANFNMTRLRY